MKYYYLKNFNTGLRILDCVLLEDEHGNKKTIPFDEKNADYIDYLHFLSNGGIVLPEESF